MTRYQEYVDQKQRQYGSKFSASSLAPQFVDAFNNRKRITIEFVNGAGKVYEVRRGTIGVTTGWVPCFLLMNNSRSAGSSFTLHQTDRIGTMDSWREYRAAELAAR